MKKCIAIILICFAIGMPCLFTGCMDQGKLELKQALCNHDWHEDWREAGNCKCQYRVRYSCHKCGKEKTEKIDILWDQIQHDWSDAWVDHSEDCQHPDRELKECSVCKEKFVTELQTYGPHIDNDDNGKCDYWIVL